MSWEKEIKRNQRYAFGKNWSSYLKAIDERHIDGAQKSLIDLFGEGVLKGKTFLDAGSGSGLFSLAARRLGAKVTSYDYDSQSVACTQALKNTYCPDDKDWSVMQGSALDEDFVGQLGKFDFVYSYGVLHHTGSMWKTFDLIDRNVKEKGTLAISIYADLEYLSYFWRFVKKTYCNYPILRPALIAFAMLRFGRFRIFTLPWQSRNPGSYRGMTWFHDALDWIGGYPYEFAKPCQIFNFFYKKSYTLTHLKTYMKHACNEYTFVKKSTSK